MPQSCTGIPTFVKKPFEKRSIFCTCLFSASQLKSEEVDFHIEQNRKAHRTDEYDAENLIIRRGQEFDVTVTFNREYKPDIDVVVLQFVVGLLKCLVLTNFGAYTYFKI